MSFYMCPNPTFVHTESEPERGLRALGAHDVSMQVHPS